MTDAARAFASARPRHADTPEDLTVKRSVGIIGMGRVGTVLALAFAEAGYSVTAGTSGSRRRRAQVGSLLPGFSFRTEADVARSCDLLILAVPDDALGDLAQRLATAGALTPGQVVLHPSGRHGTDVLGPARECGVRCIAMHPAMTFTGGVSDLERLAESRFAVTCDDADRPLAASIVADLGGQAFWIDEEQRELYHAALAHGANHLVTVISDAMDLLRAAGVDDPAGTLRPLVGAALGNALAQGDAALTGPVSRGDAGTVKRHVQQIRRTMPEALPTYAALARRTIGRATAVGRLPVAAAAQVADVLADALDGSDRLSGVPSEASR